MLHSKTGKQRSTPPPTEPGLVLASSGAVVSYKSIIHYSTSTTTNIALYQNGIYAIYFVPKFEK